MKKQYALIWDLDGTLLDSYGIIVESLKETLEEVGIQMDSHAVAQGVLKGSVSEMIKRAEGQTGRAAAALKQRYSEISNTKRDQIGLVPHAKEILAFLQKQHCRNFVFTHRGTSTMPVLDRLGLTGYFEKIITSVDGFPRKPEPEAITYLLEKYHLNPANTYYVGDRTIDMACAKNAGISGILYREEGSVVVPSGDETVIISELPDIAAILGFQEAV